MIGSAVKLGSIASAVAGQPCHRPVQQIILHHTWRPTRAQYRGWATVQGIWRYHTQSNQWADIGYHYLVGPDGLAWLGRPLGEVGAHVAGHNVGTVGVALILDGDVESATLIQKQATGELLSALLSRFQLTPDSNFAAGRGFHRDYSTKTCPGVGITKELVIGWCHKSVQNGWPKSG